MSKGSHEQLYVPRNQHFDMLEAIAIGLEAIAILRVLGRVSSFSTVFVPWSPEPAGTAVGATAGRQREEGGGGQGRGPTCGHHA